MFLTQFFPLPNKKPDTILASFKLESFNGTWHALLPLWQDVAIQDSDMGDYCPICMLWAFEACCFNFKRCCQIGCTYFAYFTGLLWIINSPPGEIPSELQIQRHPRICHWKYLQHASMETECLLSCQLVLVLELLVLFIRWLLPWWGSLSDAHACNAELTVRSCVEEKVWTVQNVNEKWWASLILFSSHLKQILGFKRLVELFSEDLFDLVWPVGVPDYTHV